MQFDRQYFADAQRAVMAVLKKARPGLLNLTGKVEYEIKSDKTLVTKFDQELEVKIRQALTVFDPKVGQWGEEHGRNGSRDHFWMIDPIDGTESFTRGLNGWRSLLTFVSDGQPRYAMAYRFVTGDLFAAFRGAGTTKNGESVRVSQRPIDRAWVEFSVNMLTQEGYAIFKRVRPKIDSITSRVDFLSICEGKLDGLIVYQSGGHEWDYAPRALLIEEAGGVVRNIGKKDYDYQDLNLIAANPIIFEELASLVA